MITKFKLFEKNTSYLGLKKGDEIVYIGDDEKLKVGEIYTIDQVLDLNNNKFVNKDSITSKYDFIAIIDKNGNKIRNKDNIRVFMAYDFSQEIEYKADKYNV